MQLRASLEDTPPGSRSHTGTVTCTSERGRKKMSDNRPKDICHECDKVDDHMTMKYVDEESTHDDRLICEECESNQE